MFSCFDPYRMQVHWFATVFTDQYSRSLLATGCMHHHDRGTIGSGIVVSPLAHCVDDRPEISPLIGQAIIKPRWMLTVRAFSEDTFFYQSLQSLLKDVARYAQSTLENVELRDAHQSVTKYEQRPPFAH